MNIYIRKIMLFIAYTAFVIIAPIVILYAIGYRPQTSSPIPKPVGVILADASPNGAQISINGTQLGSLPRSVPNIEPGTARVEISKDGYTSWAKQLEVKPTQATDIRSVHLLPSQPESLVLARNIVLFENSPNNLYSAVVTSKNALTIVDDTGASIVSETALQNRPTAMSWSPDGSHIIVTFPKNLHQLYRVDSEILTKIPSTFLTGFTSIHWSPIAANTIYALDKNSALVTYTISTTQTEIIKPDINLFTIVGRTLYHQTFDNELRALQLRSVDDTLLIADTKKALKRLTGATNGSLALLFQDGELTVYKSNKEYITISPSAADMSWSPDGQLLLVQTLPTELSVYNIDSQRLFAVPLNELHLITRLTQTITNPRWFTDSRHILYETNNELVFSEIDTRDHPISLVIDPKKASGHLVFGDESKNIIYLQQNGKETNLVQTWLVTEEDK